MQNSSFQYNVLPTARSIRLVRIHGSDRDSDDIYCTIETHPLDSHPPYAALSYTWGSQKSKKIIHCNNDSVLLVTQNLWRALRRLKPQLGDDRTLWIDAICINQEDLRERSAQVQLMRDIFQSAERVLIWIGEEQDHSAGAFELARRLAQLSTTQAQEASKDLASAGLPPRGASEWKSLEALYHRKLFSRVWCIQEIAVASKATIICGGIEVPWEHLIGSANMLDSFKLFYQTGIADRGFLGLGEPRLRSMSVTLQDILQFAWSWEATDPRDKIYALLGLASDRAASKIVPDYTSSVAELYKRVAIYHLQKYGLEFLELAGDTSLRRVDGLPSWCPDWSNSTWYNIGKYESSVRYYANQPAGADTRMTINFSQENNILRVRGKIIDKIKTASVQKYERPSDITLVTIPIITNVLRSLARRIRWLRWQVWEKTALNLKTYPTGEDLLSLYGQVLVAGSQEHRVQFNRLMNDSPRPLSELANTDKSDWFYSCFRRHELNIYEAERDIDEPKRATETLAACLYADEVENWSENRRLITTEGGYLGMAPLTARASDRICLLAGTNSQFLLRGKKGKYRFIGACYIHGVQTDSVSTDEMSEICIV